MKTRWQVILISLAVFFIGAVLILLGYSWFQNKMARVDAGTARPNFPYSDYSQAELEKLYPQYIENNAPTVQSPEETHRKFVDALKKGDFDEAVKCCVIPKKKDEILLFLKQVKEKGKLEEMINDLERDFVKESTDNNKATYSFAILENGEKFGHFVDFIKSSQGVWLIESL